MWKASPCLCSSPGTRELGWVGLGGFWGVRLGVGVFRRQLAQITQVFWPAAGGFVGPQMAQADDWHAQPFQLNGFALGVGLRQSPRR